LLTACSALTLAACGGSGDAVQQQVDIGPVIESGTAEQLAVRSDEIARLLEGGDNCAAMAEGARLRDELNVAINRGVIPEIYLEDLSGIVNEIQALIPPCTPEQTDEPQVPPPPRKQEKRKGGGGGDEGDD
jgi:hypothetical protein